MAPTVGLVGGDWPWLDSRRTLKKVMLTLLFKDGHMACPAMSALFPLIGKYKQIVYFRITLLLTS
jgi:hypothetical protein